jgi:Tfp pilus assembly protein PilN
VIEERGGPQEETTMKSLFEQRRPASDSFLPEEYVAERADARANALTLTLFAIALAGVVAAFFVTNRHWQSLRSRQEAINAEYQAEGKKIEQLKSLESQRAAILEKAEITAALVEKLPRWAVLGEITLRMPLTMRLDQCSLKSTRVNPTPPGGVPGKTPPQSLVKNIADKGKDKKGDPKKEEKPRIEPPKFEYALSIEGTADENNDVADFLASLKQSPAFDTVELTFIKDAKELGRDMRKFQITASLRKGAGTGELSTSLQDLVIRRTEAMKLMKEHPAGAAPATGSTSTAGVSEQQEGR